MLIKKKCIEKIIFVPGTQIFGWHCYHVIYLCQAGCISEKAKRKRQQNFSAAITKHLTDPILIEFLFWQQNPFFSVLIKRMLIKTKRNRSGREIAQLF